MTGSGMILDKLNLHRATGAPEAFYPPIEPYRTGRLRVSELHELYYEEVGNPDGKPAVLLHGGPGAGLIPLYRQAFDPEQYRVVLFDQRGCGKSTPRGELRENTTWDIVADVEKLRAHLGIDRWLVFGRYDLITPLKNGWDLKKAWPEAEPVIVPDEGHAFNEPGIAAALVAATDHFVAA